ncbi:energy transducer TonB [Rariglobus hedericola]|uniref:TonB family protein n=1 Tax=Rariglobus hedericola TaxID=2597822 RepID=A0A556QNV9_9BACT|nr:energy transducer TonB [Rariglobus hedericola]TSJ78338.1 TonB family protein [Rariglobus hedericola]
MKRDLIIGLIVALLIHGGLALGGDFLKGKPAPAPVDDSIPVVELAPLPPLEPETLDMPEPSSEGGGDLSDLVPPMQADTPAPTASTFTQQIQPPPPPGISRPATITLMHGRPGTGIGTGTGDGFKNIFDLASLDQLPAPRTPIRPVYPHEMSRAGINGEVSVGFIVDSEGSVRNAYVISSTNREFEPEALRAVSRAKFKPGRKNGTNVSTRNVQLTITFNISGN